MRSPTTLLLQFRGLAQKSLSGFSGTLLVAVSGGSDSVALLHLLLASGVIPPARIVVAHFNHNLRPEAHRDAAFVAAMAAGLGLTCLCETWADPPGQGNLPELARTARYDFLLRAARQVGATCVATGHQREDQAETLLERLLRGSGVGGLAAMRSQRPLGEGVLLVRPLLSLGREALRGWLREQQIPWRDDPSNANPQRRRSQLRHQLLPLLAQVTRGDPSLGLALTAARLGDADTALTWATDQAWQALAPILDGAAITLPVPPLLRLPDELQVRILRRAHHLITATPHPPGSRAMQGVLHLLKTPRRHWQMRIQGAALRRDEESLTMTCALHGPRET